jgi:hypothetical protein
LYRSPSVSRAYGREQTTQCRSTSVLSMTGLRTVEASHGRRTSRGPTPHACRRHFLSILYLDGTTPNHFIVHGDGVARRLHFFSAPTTFVDADMARRIYG